MKTTNKIYKTVGIISICLLVAIIATLVVLRHVTVLYMIEVTGEQVWDDDAIDEYFEGSGIIIHVKLDPGDHFYTANYVAYNPFYNRNNENTYEIGKFEILKNYLFVDSMDKFYLAWN